MESLLINLHRKDGALLGAITPIGYMVFPEVESSDTPHLEWTALIAFYEKEFHIILKTCHEISERIKEIIIWHLQLK